MLNLHNFCLSIIHALYTGQTVNFYPHATCAADKIVRALGVFFRGQVVNIALFYIFAFLIISAMLPIP